MIYEDYLNNNLKGDEKILEIGGKSSSIIKKILKDSSNLVVLKDEDEYNEIFKDDGYECLLTKNGINFDTIIISNDAVIFAVFLYKYPEILKDINLVIIYNDFYEVYHYLYIKHNLVNNCFKKSLGNELYEVWNRIN